MERSCCLLFPELELIEVQNTLERLQFWGSFLGLLFLPSTGGNALCLTLIQFAPPTRHPKFFHFHHYGHGNAHLKEISKNTNSKPTCFLVVVIVFLSKFLFLRNTVIQLSNTSFQPTISTPPQISLKTSTFSVLGQTPLHWVTSALQYWFSCLLRTALLCLALMIFHTSYVMRRHSTLCTTSCTLLPWLETRNT